MESKLVNHPIEVKETGWYKFRVHFCEYWYIYSCVFLALLVAIFFMVHQYYDTDEPIDSSIWGQYGDFVGGVLGTIFGVISVLLVIKTFNHQQTATSDNKQQLEIERFHDLFFELLHLYQSQVSELCGVYKTFAEAKTQNVDSNEDNNYEVREYSYNNKDFFDFEKEKLQRYSGICRPLHSRGHTVPYKKCDHLRMAGISG